MLELQSISGGDGLGDFHLRDGCSELLGSLAPHHAQVLAVFIGHSPPVNNVFGCRPVDLRGAFGIQVIPFDGWLLGLRLDGGFLTLLQGSEKEFYVISGRRMGAWHKTKLKGL